MTSLVVSTEETRGLADRLTAVRSRLEAASASSQGLQEAVGGGVLADALDSFSGKWDDRRRELVDQISQLGDAADYVAQAFEDADSGLAGALADGSAS